MPLHEELTILPFLFPFSSMNPSAEQQCSVAGHGDRQHAASLSLKLGNMQCISIPILAELG